jgi:hypothetical protein
MKILVGGGIIVLIALGAVMLLEPYVIDRAKGLERDGKVADEIALLREAERMVPWGSGISNRLDDALLRQVEQGLQADRLDVAARGFREAWPRMKARGKAQNDRVLTVAVTTFARGADRLRRQGRLSLAADFNDSLFVYAVRAPDPLHRQAALQAFTEGLNLRVQDGKPCAALARVTWAKRGLGGAIPGLDPSIEHELAQQCSRARQGRSR